MDVIEHTDVPANFEVAQELWAGNGYSVPDFRFTGPPTVITKESVTPPDGFRIFVP